MKKLILTTSILLASYISKAQLDLNQLKTRDSSMYSFVEYWVGTAYRFGGNDKNGIDCSAFARKFYETIYSIELPRVAREQYKAITRVKKEALELGDLVFFRNNSPSGWHVGVYLLDGYFVHAANRKSGVKISYLYETSYVKTYLSGGRIEYIL